MRVYVDNNITTPEYMIKSTIQYHNYKAKTALTLIPTTPPPRPSHPSITALHTGHLATFASSPPPASAPRLSVDLTAVKRQEPQERCPQGVIVAFVGGEKQMGQV